MATATCANGDISCISGVGAQQGASLTQQTRDAIAAGATATSRQAGVIAAGATAATAAAPAQVKPVTGAVAIGATVLGTGADALEQAMKPDPGKTIVNLLGTAASEAANRTLPIAAPLSNEALEAIKGSSSVQDIQNRINSFLDGLFK